MGVISSEIVHFLKVTLSLQNDQRWLLLLIWFSKFFGRGPPDPPSRLEIFDLLFNSTLLNTSLKLKVSLSTKELNNKSNFFLISDSWAIHLLAKDLLHPFHTIIYHNMDLKIRIR